MIMVTVTGWQYLVLMRSDDEGIILSGRVDYLGTKSILMYVMIMVTVMTWQ